MSPHTGMPSTGRVGRRQLDLHDQLVPVGELGRGSRSTLLARASMGSVMPLSEAAPRPGHALEAEPERLRREVEAGLAEPARQRSAARARPANAKGRLTQPEDSL